MTMTANAKHVEEARAQVEAARAARGDVPTVRVNGRTFKPGDQFKVRGERGTFAFTSARVVDDVCRWVDCYQCDRRYPAHARAFTPDRIVRKLRAKVEA